MAHRIKQVMVLGAGTMGAAIAAHCANAGLEVNLLNIAPKEGDDKNAVVKAGYEWMQKAEPANLMSKTVAERMRLGNFDDDFGRIADADWILEAIIEKLEPKQGLMAHIEEIAKDTAVISSNTSGIPLHMGGYVFGAFRPSTGETLILTGYPSRGERGGIELSSLDCVLAQLRLAGTDYSLSPIRSLEVQQVRK